MEQTVSHLANQTNRLKTAMSDQERKQKQREKDRLLRLGQYSPSLVEQAKAMLSQAGAPDLELLIAQPPFNGSLGEEDVRHLKKFIQNNRYRERMRTAVNDKQRQHELTIRERVTRIENQQAAELHRALLIAYNQSDRTQLILQKIDENKFLLLEYLQAYPPPTPDFLTIVVGLRGRIDDMSFTQLLKRVCALHKGEDLIFDAWMVRQVMEHLLDHEEDHACAFGLLRLAFQSNISFTQFPIAMIQQFQNGYEVAISNFYKALPSIKSFVIDQIPPTLYAFTTPMLKCLRDGGGELHRQIPYQFLPHIIELLCYSFTEDQQSFDGFLETLRDACSRLYEHLRSSGFCNILQELVHAVQEQQPRFFRSLDEVTAIVKAAAQLASDRRVITFDGATIRNLVDGGIDQRMQLSHRPRQLRGAGSKALVEMHQRALSKQDDGPWSRIDLSLPLAPHQLKPFLAMGISALLASQEYAVRLHGVQEQPSALYLNIQTGQGKSALCLGLAAISALQGIGALILNQSAELTFRDYKVASRLSEDLGVRVELFQPTSPSTSNEARVIYCDSVGFDSLIAGDDLERMGHMLVIIDEFDSFLLGSAVLNEARRHAVRAIQNAIMVSGSEMERHHLEYIQMQLGGVYLDVRPSKCLALQQRRVSCSVHNRVDAFRSEIVELACQQTKKTPVVVISSIHSERIAKMLSQLGVRCENLAKTGIIGQEGAMETFIHKFSDRYPAFIISEDQGRGLDFQTESEVEKEGGVFVIIAAQPQSTLELSQFIGRTGRVGNRGQYALIFHDKHAAPQEGECYLHKLISKLKDEDLLLFTKLRSPDAHQSLPPNIALSTTTKPQETASPVTPQHKSASHLNAKTEPSGQEGLEEEKIAKRGPRNPGDFEQCESPNPSPRHSDGTDPGSLRERRNRKWDIKRGTAAGEILRSPSSQVGEIDSPYFQGYGVMGIHEEMLSDDIRMAAYREAIRELASGKTVIDVGAGTAPLSIMAAEAGALKVIAIEKSQIVTEARRRIHRSGQGTKIVLHHMLAEEFALTGVKADLIVSEWMGYMLFYEHMLPSVLAVRDHCLLPGGTIIPYRARLLAAPVGWAEDEDALHEGLAEGVWGSASACMDCPSGWLIGREVAILDVDIMTTDLYDNIIQSKVSCTFSKASRFTGIVLWFEAMLSPTVTLSTSPQLPSTHWKQTILYLPEPIQVEASSIVDVNFAALPQVPNHRAVGVRIELDSTDPQTHMQHIYRLD